MSHPRDDSGRERLVRDALDRYEGPLLRYAARFAPDLERARDVVQETFLRLCSVDQDRLAAGVGEWLFTVCRNRAIDVGRKERRMKPVGEGTTLDRESADPAPREVMESRETKTRLLDLLGTLPPDQQEVLRLKFQEGMSYKEISRITEHTVSNVGYLIHVGIKTLRRQLAPSAGASRD